MAEKRMFAKSIVLSDAFLDMPMSARCLYFTLGMLADDDGFIGNPKSIMRQCGASQDDMLVLLGKRYILSFESGVIVIKHWRINNYLKNDRHKNTTYLEEMDQLTLDKKGAYTENVSTLYPDCIQNGEQVETQYSIDKDSIDKDSIDKDSIGAPAPTKHAYGEYGWVKLTGDEYTRLMNDFGEAETNRCIQYVDESAQSTRNKNKWKDWNLVVRRCHREGWGLNRGGAQPVQKVYDASELGDLPY